MQSRARKSAGKFLVYCVQEVEKEREWLFESALTCCRDEKTCPKRGGSAVKAMTLHFTVSMLMISRG